MDNEFTQCLSAFEYAQLEQLCRTQQFVNEALRQLERILESAKFARVHFKTRDFLRFIVSKTLIGHVDQIKEMTIAIRVFRESADFDPLLSSKVRVSGLALRRRLAAYYAKEGECDPIEIIIPIGTYVPRIRGRRASNRLKRCWRGLPEE